jgi:hypothetical protein
MSFLSPRPTLTALTSHRQLLQERWAEANGQTRLIAAALFGAAALVAAYGLYSSYVVGGWVAVLALPFAGFAGLLWVRRKFEEHQVPDAAPKEKKRSLLRRVLFGWKNR